MTHYPELNCTLEALREANAAAIAKVAKAVGRRAPTRFVLVSDECIGLIDADLLLSALEETVKRRDPAQTPEVHVPPVLAKLRKEFAALPRDRRVAHSALAVGLEKAYAALLDATTTAELSRGVGGQIQLQTHYAMRRAEQAYRDAQYKLERILEG